MKLTSEFIELQGFVPYVPEEKTILNCLPRFKNYTYEIGNDAILHLHWDPFRTFIFIDKLTRDDDDNVDRTRLCCSKIVATMVQFANLYSRYVKSGEVRYPTNFAQQLMTNKYRRKYSMREYEQMFKIALTLSITLEDYETCEKLIKFREKKYNKMKWEYNQIDKIIFENHNKFSQTIKIA